MYFISVWNVNLKTRIKNMRRGNEKINGIINTGYDQAKPKKYIKK
jgi:hypothetical protein